MIERLLLILAIEGGCIIVLLAMIGFYGECGLRDIVAQLRKMDRGKGIGP